jgi:IS30 family transposase
MLLLKTNTSLRGIAKEINRHPSSVSREVKPNKKSRYIYCATCAAKTYQKPRKKSERPFEIQVGSRRY